MASWHQGKFKPQNPLKYKGTHPIVYRSSWELKYMMDLDTDKNVLEWSSESVIVPYISPKDKKIHRYFCDFFVKKKINGVVKSFLVEIKPKKETLPPVKGKGRRYFNECMTYCVNQAKWKSAQEYCKIKGWEFQVMTEVELRIPIKFKPKR